MKKWLYDFKENSFEWERSFKQSILYQKTNPAEKTVDKCINKLWTWFVAGKTRWSLLGSWLSRSWPITGGINCIWIMDVCDVPGERLSLYVAKSCLITLWIKEHFLFAWRQFRRKQHSETDLLSEGEVFNVFNMYITFCSWKPDHPVLRNTWDSKICIKNQNVWQPKVMSFVCLNLLFV